MTWKQSLASLALAAGLAPVAWAQRLPGCESPSPQPGVLMPAAPLAGTGSSPGANPSLLPGLTGGTPAASALGGAAAAGSAVGGGGGESGSSGLASAAPGFVGDLGVRGLYLEQGYRGSPGRMGSPISTQATFRIIENESARPLDRVFVSYNYFADAGKPVDNSYDLHRVTVGLEKAFLDGNASLGARLPFLVRDGGLGESVDGIADATVIAKAVLLADRQAGNYLSAGMALTIPLGRDPKNASGESVDTFLFQPFLGFVYNADRFFVQGFTAAVIPDSSSGSRFWANDVGIGYKLWQNRDCGATLTSIVPTLEAHLLSPLNNQGVGSVTRGETDLGATNQVVLTGAVHLGLWNRAWLTFGAATPISGPRLFAYEGVVQLNVGF